MINKFTLGTFGRKLRNDGLAKKGGMLLCFMLFGLTAEAQISVTVTNSGNTTPNLQPTYSSLSAALDGLNAVTAMTGPVSLALTGSEVAPNKGLTLGSATLNPLLSATNRITISGPATLTAGEGDATATGASPDGIFKLLGADYVTIDGLTFTDGNTAAPIATTSMEFGLGMFKASATDGCQHNTIMNCVFNMQSGNITGGTAPMPGGSVGILMVNSVAGAATTALTPTADSGSNSYNNFFYNFVNGGNISIALVGSAPVAFADMGNKIGGDIPQHGNNFLNFGGTASATTCAVFTQHQQGVWVGYNIVNNATSGLSQTATCRGIYLTNSTSASATVSHNIVTVVSAASGNNYLAAIENTSGSTAADNKIEISYNGIENCSFPNPTSSTTFAFAGIFNSGTAAIVDISNNDIKNNNCGKSATTGALTMAAIWNSASLTTQNFTADNNEISGNSLLNAQGNLYGIVSGNQTVHAGGNLIYNLTMPNLSGASNGGKIFAIFNNYNTAGSNVKETYSYNEIWNLKLQGTHTGSTNQIWGIVTSNGAATNNTVMEINGNKIHDLTSELLGQTNMRGIAVQGSKDASVYGNKMYNFNAVGSNASISALFVNNSSGTTNVYNNYIGNLTLPGANSAAPLAGMNLASATATNVMNVSYNTVVLNASSTGALFGSKCIAVNPGSTLTLRNNLLVNNSTAAGTGKTIVFERAATDYTKYSTASNNNLFYGPILFSDGTNAPATLADFKTLVGPTRESASISENPTFLSTTGSDALYLHIDGSVASAIKNGGIPIASISSDYDGDSRKSDTPDIGADEFDFVNLKVTNPLATCTASTVDMTAAAVTAGSETGLTLTYWTDEDATLVHPNPAAATSGTYYIKGERADGNYVIRPITVVIATAPVVVVTNPAPACAPATADLTAEAVTQGSDADLEFTYWTDVQATVAYNTPETATAGTYYIKGTNTAAGCFTIKPVTVVVGTSFIVNNPAAVCEGSTVDITAAAITAGSPADFSYSYWTDEAATISYATPTAATDGTYYIKGINAVTTCSFVLPVEVTVDEAPHLVVADPLAVCSPATVDITSAGITAGSESNLTLTYWTDEAATIPYNTPTQATEGTYYIKATHASNSCTTVEPVEVTVHDLPVLVVTDPAAACSPATVNLTAPAVTAGSDNLLILSYWTDEAATMQYNTPAQAAAGTYYIKAISISTGCSAIKPVVATVNSPSTPTFTQVAPVCHGTAQSPLPAASNESITGLWTPTFDNTMTMEYTFQPAVGQCANTAKMTVVVKDMVPAPTGSAQQNFSQGATVASLQATGVTNGVISWFATEADALAGTPVLSPSAVLENGNYYAMQELSGCRNAAPFVVTVTVTPLSADQFDMSGLRYYPNPVKEELTVSYKHAISSIEVFNLLGQQIMSVRPNAFEAKVDMNQMPAGTYMLQLNADGKSTMIKVIKN